MGLDWNIADIVALAGIITTFALGAWQLLIKRRTDYSTRGKTEMETISGWRTITDEMRGDISDLYGQIGSLRSRVHYLETENARLQAELAAERGINKELKQKLAQLTARMQSVESNNATLLKENRELSERLKKFEHDSGIHRRG